MGQDIFSAPHEVVLLPRPNLWDEFSTGPENMIQVNSSLVWEGLFGGLLYV